MTILCYHAIDPDWTSSLSVPPNAFARQAGWLARRQTVVPLGVAVERLGRAGTLPDGLSSLTFDDGFDSLYLHAFPILRSLGLPGTVFLVAETLTREGRRVDWVDTPPPGPLRTLTVDQVLEMQEAGLSFASHSWSHRDLTALTDEECERDLRRSREFLEDLLSTPVRFLAYPRNRHNVRVRKAAERAGYTHAFCEEVRKPESRTPYAVGRAGVYPGNGMWSFRAKASRWYLPFRASPVFPAVRRVLKGQPSGGSAG